jgi:hypothetical protein
VSKEQPTAIFVRGVPGWLHRAIEKFRTLRLESRGKRPSKADAIRELLVSGLHEHGIKEETHGEEK